MFMKKNKLHIVGIWNYIWNMIEKWQLPVIPLTFITLFMIKQFPNVEKMKKIHNVNQKMGKIMQIMRVYFPTTITKYKCKITDPLHYLLQCTNKCILRPHTYYYLFYCKYVFYTITKLVAFLMLFTPIIFTHFLA